MLRTEDASSSIQRSMTWFYAITGVAWLGVVLLARAVRSGAYAAFVAVILGIYALIASAVASQTGALLPIFAALHGVVFVNFVGLALPRMRGLGYRLLVSWPAAFFAAGTLLALPWALAIAVGFDPWALWLPYGLAVVGVFQSLTTKREEVHLVLGGQGDPEGAGPIPHPRGSAREERPLRVVQITDPHLGPFMSVARLRRIAERAVERRPDLVLLTGDFLTMESQRDVEHLTEALRPLRALEGRVFACHGNHDHEAPAVVARALADNGVRLLVDASAVVETDAGPVQIVGVDFVWRDRQAHLERVCREHAHVPGATRIVLLHDPGAFRHVPAGHGDLVLSGHTHGGQVGLVSLGLPWTILRAFAGARVPDHGYWARGRDRLYVHRGTGHYGFPVRLGVPAEESVLLVHRPARTSRDPAGA